MILSRLQLATKLLLASSLLASLLCFSPALAQAPALPAGAELAANVPANAPLCVAIPNLQSAYNKYQATGLGKWLNSAAMKPFRDSLKDTDAVSLCNVQGMFGFEDKLLAQFATPAIVIAVPTATGGDVVLLIQAKFDSPEVAACLKSADAYHTARKAKKTNFKLAGTELLTSYQAPAVPPATTGTEHVYFSTHGFFGVSSGMEGVQLLLKNWPASAAKSLQATAEFKAAMKPLAGSSDVLYFSRPLELASLWEKKPAELKRGERTWTSILKNEGFTKIQGIGGQLMLNTADDDVAFNLFMAAPQPYEKGMRILSWKPGPKLPLPAWMPGGLAEMLWINSDPEEQFEAYANWFDELEAEGDEGTFQDIIDSVKNDPKGPKVDLEKDFWGKLEPSTMSVTDAHALKDGLNLLGEQTLSVSTVVNPAAVQTSLEKYFKNDKEVMTAKLPDGQIWWVKRGSSLFIQGGGENLPQTNTVAISGKYVVLSDNTDWVKNLLTAPPANKAQADLVLAPVLKRVESFETQATSARQVVRFDESWEASYEGMRAGNAKLADNSSVRLLKLILTGTSDDKFAKNFPLLPAFAKVKVYLSPGGASYDSSSQGILGKGFLLKPTAVP